VQIHLIFTDDILILHFPPAMSRNSKQLPNSTKKSRNRRCVNQF